jgi:hypothetical protein
MPAVETKVPLSGSVDDNTAIKSFLLGCHPPLLHLLPTFAILGFKDDETLKGVARWPKDELAVVLEKWRTAGYLSYVEAEAVRIALMAHV